MEKLKLNAIGAIDLISKDICDLSDAIWEVPETAFRETESTRLQCEVLEKLGFAPSEGVSVRISMLVDTPTGVVATKNDELVYFALLSEHRGIGLSAQLLGEAVSVVRKNRRNLFLCRVPEAQQ